MDLADIVMKARAENILFSVLVELTYRCNLDCFFCYNDTGLRGEPLSRAQYERFFEDLAALGVLHLALSGGEPLAHPDFFALGAKARELGFVVRVKSNGHALRGALARRLKDEVDPYVVEVSLHGSTAEVHDRQTRVAGSFARLMENIPAMRAAGLRVRVNSTVTAWNEHQVEAMMDLCDDLGVLLQLDPEVTPRDDGDTSPLDIAPSAAGIRELYRLQHERLAAAVGEAAPAPAIGRDADRQAPPGGGKYCGAGSSTLAVDPYGEVYPCVQWRWSVGNLHRRPIAEIWRDSGMLDRIRGLNREVKQVVEGKGPDGRLMNFCPGAAALDSGRPTEIYPRAEVKSKLRRQVLEAARSDGERRRQLLRVVR